MTVMTDPSEQIEFLSKEITPVVHTNHYETIPTSMTTIKLLIEIRELAEILEVAVNSRPTSDEEDMTIELKQLNDIADGTVPTPHSYKIYEKKKSKNSDFIRYTAKYIERNTITGHEGLFGAVKGYADFDISYDTMEEQEAKSVEDTENAIAGFKAVFGIADNSQIAVLTADGESSKKTKNGVVAVWKNSIHIIANNGVVFDCGMTVKKVMQEANYAWVVEPDWMVYGRRGCRKMMRIIMTSNYREERGLYPYGLNLYDTHETLISMPDSAITNRGEVVVPLKPTGGNAKLETKALTVFKAEYPVESANWLYKSTVQKEDCTMINMNRLAPSECLVCPNATQHDNDNCLHLVLYPDGNAFLSCAKKAKDVKMVLLVEKKISARTIMYNTIINATDKTLPQLNYQNAIDFKNAGYDVHVVNSEFCADIPALMNTMQKQIHSIVGILSGLGTGKTFANIKAIEAFVLEHPDARILVISMRISLAKKYAKDYKTAEFICYRDKTLSHVITQNRVICQLDSLGRIRWSKAGRDDFCDMVVIDEASQALKHMFSNSFMGNLNLTSNLDNFLQCIKFAKQVVCMDANLDVNTMNVIRTLRNNPADTNILFINEYLRQHLELQMTDKMVNIVRLVKSGLDRSEKCGIASNFGCETIFNIRDQLVKHKPGVKVLVICSDTLHLPEVKKALENPNEEWGKYDVVIYSPTVQGGISYDVKDVFDRLYGIFCNSTNLSDDACQMLDRIRHPRVKEVVVSFSYYMNYLSNGGGLTDKRAYVNYLSRVRDFGDYEKKSGDEKKAFKGLEHNTMGCKNEYGEKQFEANWFFKLYVEFKTAENINKANWCEGFVRRQHVYGNTITMLDEANDTEIGVNKAIRVDFKDTREVRKIALSKQLCNAKSINSERVAVIRTEMKKADNDITEQDKLELQKHVLTDIFDLHVEADTPEWFAMLNGNKKIKQFHNLKPWLSQATGTLNGGLAYVKMMEQKAEVKRRQIITEGGVAKAVSTTTAIAKSLADSTKYKVAKYTLLIKWLVKLGFKSLFDDGVRVNAVDLKLTLQAIHADDFKNYCELCTILGKQTRKMKSISKIDVNSDGFVKSMLAQINGTLYDTWGIKVANVNSKNKHVNDYHIQNNNITNGIFRLGRANDEKSMFGNFTPCFIEVDEEDDTMDKEVLTVDDKMRLLFELRDNEVKEVKEVKAVRKPRKTPEFKARTDAETVEYLKHCKDALNKFKAEGKIK
jgi:hypothetical protein